MGAICHFGDSASQIVVPLLLLNVQTTPPDRKFSNDRNVAERDWALSGSASSQLVVYGFLTSCRKDFTSPGDFKGALIKTGDSETRKGLA